MKNIENSIPKEREYVRGSAELKERCEALNTYAKHVELSPHQVSQAVKAYKKGIDIKKSVSDELFSSWAEQIGYNRAVLVSCGYPVKKVLGMTEEDAEAEVQAITD